MPSTGLAPRESRGPRHRGLSSLRTIHKVFLANCVETRLPVTEVEGGKARVDSWRVKAMNSLAGRKDGLYNHLPSLRYGSESFMEARAVSSSESPCELPPMTGDAEGPSLFLAYDMAAPKPELQSCSEQSH